jgi:pyruvate dehydrogenase E2 component (dihydrolipoamide acetyltransferase)
LATHEIFMPALSSTMTEGKIVEWLKKPGDRVGRGESVLVVESDKADMDVESFNEGFLAAVLMPAGGTAPVGETIGLIVETEAEIAGVQAQAPAASPAPQAPAPAPRGATSYSDKQAVPPPDNDNSPTRTVTLPPTGRVSDSIRACGIATPSPTPVEPNRSRSCTASASCPVN